ncbi:MAG: hypothetical protein OHK0048_18730 [Rhodoferax sp.]
MENTTIAPSIRRALACTVLSLGLQPLAGWAEDVLAPRPEFVKGERWVYQKTDLWTDNVQDKYEDVFAEVLDNKLVFRGKSLIQDKKPWTLYFSRDLQPCRSLSGESEEICAGILKFPLRSIGERWGFNKLPWSNGKGYYEADCELTAQEKIRVPAGEYDTLRIACKGRWQRTVDGNSNGRYEETLWYAPAVKRHVRIDYNDWTAGNRLDTRIRTELVEVQLK